MEKKTTVALEAEVKALQDAMVDINELSTLFKNAKSHFEQATGALLAKIGNREKLEVNGNVRWNGKSMSVLNSEFDITINLSRHDAKTLAFDILKSVD